MPAPRAPRKPKIEGWIRRLENGRLEIFLKVEDSSPLDRKIRASGPDSDMLELVEWFEEKTGLQVSSPVLPKRVKPPMPGSQPLFEIGDEATSELESEDPDA